MKSLRYTLPILLFAGLILAGCGPKPEMSRSLLDTPDYHVSQGMKLLEEGNVDDAEISFQRALALDPKFAEASSGMALVEAARGHFDKARDLANDGVARAKKDPFTWAVRGRVKTMQMKGDDWLENADRDFKKASELDPLNGLVYYWWGIAKENGFDFDEASKLFSRTIELKGEWAAPADREFQKVQKVLRAAPGTKIGKRIALINKIDRADLAVLFLEELKLDEVLKKVRPKTYDNSFQPPDAKAKPTFNNDHNLPDDVRNSWARTWIKQILQLGVMEVSPDGRFYPNRPVTRAEFALFLQNILIDVMHDPGLATKYIGEPSRFKDMNSSTATYNAAALAVDRGVMSARIDGTFGPNDSVSGADALLTIREFQNQLRMQF